MNLDPEADPLVMAAALRASQTLDAASFLEICASGLVEILRPAAVHAYLRVPGGNHLELRGSWPEKRRGGHRPPQRLDPVASETRVEDPSGEGGAPRGTWEAARAEADPAHPARLVVPVGTGPDAAFLACGSQEQFAFEPDGVQRARALARLVGPALRNLLYVGDLRETAVRDDLARCYNRRHFEAFLAEEIERARRFRSRMSVVFLDMDNLKIVNTAHGHAMGSRALQEIVERAAAGIRSIDKLFRFGGDEFCLVLPQTDQRGAAEVAERVRRAIAGAPLLSAEVGGVGMTASLGVATFPDHASTAEGLVQAADGAMQRIKRAGKNAVAVADPLVDAPPPPGRRTEERA